MKTALEHAASVIDVAQLKSVRELDACSSGVSSLSPCAASSLALHAVIAP